VSGRGAGVAALALLVPLLAGCDGGFPEGSLKAARLTRGDCFWACPAYSVEIRGDGRVIYQGRKNVVVVGRREGRVAPDDVARVLAAARAADFYDLRRVYLGRVSDNPLNTVRVRVGWRSHTVTEYAGEHACMPASVGALEAAIDQAAGVRRWVAGDASTLPALRAERYDFGSADAARMLKQALTYGGPDDLILALIAGGALKAQAAKDEALELAVERGRAAVVRGLLAAGARIGGPDRSGRTLLSRAADFDPGSRAPGEPAGDAAGVIRALVTTGADVRQKDEFGATALHYAATPAAVTALLAAGADREARTAEGSTPLIYGGLGEDAVLALIAAGANVDAKDEDGLGLAHLATLDRWPRVRAWLVAHGKPVEPEEAGSVQEKARALSPNC
jgi:hypothetical protein